MLSAGPSFLAAVAGLLVSVTAAEPALSPLKIRWVLPPGASNEAQVEVVGIPSANLSALARDDWNLSQWPALLSVVAETGDLGADLHLPSMAGQYDITGNTLRFRPTFPLTPGLRYRAVFRPKELPGPIPQPAEPLVAVHQAPARARPSTTVVTAIFPSSSALPENLLKFYLHFSAPMSRGHIYDYLQLRDEVGQPVELPFLEIDEELWNPDMTRLTLFLDPGRIKRGVLPLEEVGPALVEGKRYTLVIDRAWQDGQGNPLREGFTKSFSVGPADRTPPDPDAWRLDPPRAGARTPLALHFDEPLDQALAARILRVVGPGDEFIAGSISLSDAEQRWSFVPDQPWAPGAYQVVIPTHIEDRAGNNIGKPFEVDLVERVERRVTHSAVTRRFDVH